MTFYRGFNTSERKKGDQQNLSEAIKGGIGLPKLTDPNEMPMLWHADPIKICSERTKLYVRSAKNAVQSKNSNALAGNYVLCLR